MAKISNITSYPKKTSPVGADTVIGTDSQDGNATKQFPVSGIINAVATGGGVVTSVSGSGPVNATPTSGDVNVTLNTVPNVANTYQYANIDVDQYGRVVNAYDGTPVTSVNGIDGAVTLSAGDGASVVIDPADPQNIIISSTGSGGSGSVTQVSAGGGIETSPAGGITTTGTVSLQDFGPALDRYKLIGDVKINVSRTSRCHNIGQKKVQGLVTVKSSRWRLTHAIS
jgi:hypothetical protein